MLEINLEQINKLFIDKYGRKSGIFSIDKPKGMTSHDIVYEVRRKLATKKVGHAGALDPFADGLLLILVGKFTRKTEQFINLDKSYIARVLFGVETDSGDIEGKILKIEPKTYTNKEISEALEKFNGAYDQYVPVYSSVKVSGLKLRELARQSAKFEIIEKDDKKYAKFIIDKINQNKKLKHKIDGDEVIIEIPKKHVKIDIKLNSTGMLNASELKFLEENNGEFQYVDIEVSCSKGTYIRQLAQDIGQKLGGVGMLVELRRTSIGKISEMIELDEFNKYEF